MKNLIKQVTGVSLVTVMLVMLVTPQTSQSHWLRHRYEDRYEAWYRCADDLGTLYSSHRKARKACNGAAVETIYKTNDGVYHHRVYNDDGTYYYVDEPGLVGGVVHGVGDLVDAIF